MFRNFLFFTCLLSLIVPRSGTKVGEIPLSIPSLLFVLLIGLCFLDKVILKRMLPRTVISGSILLYLGWAIVSGMRSIGSAMFVNVANFATSFIIFPLVFFLMVSYLKTRFHLGFMLNIILLSLVIVSLYGFAQFLLGFEKVTIPGLTMSYADFFIPYVLNLKQNVAPGPAGQKMFSTFHNGNIFGNHLITFIPLIIVMFFEFRTGVDRIFSLVVGTLAAAALVCTLSRGAAAGFLTSLIFLFLITRRKSLKIFCITIVMVAVLTGIVFDLKYRYVDQVITDPTGTRIAQWRTGMDSIKSLDDKRLLSLFLFGIGLGGEIEGMSSFYNTYLTMWLDMGIIGPGLFIWLIFRLFRASLIGVGLTKDPVILIFLVGGTAGILGTLVHMSVDTLFLLPPIAQNFWMLVGLITIAIKLALATQNGNQ